MSVKRSIFDIIKENVRLLIMVTNVSWYIWGLLLFISLLMTGFAEADYSEGESDKPFFGIPRHKTRTFYKWWYSIMGVFLVILIVMQILIAKAME